MDATMEAPLHTLMLLLLLLLMLLLLFLPLLAATPAGNVVTPTADSRLFGARTSSTTDSSSRAQRGSRTHSLLLALLPRATIRTRESRATFVENTNLPTCSSRRLRRRLRCVSPEDEGVSTKTGGLLTWLSHAGVDDDRTRIRGDAQNNRFGGRFTPQQIIRYTRASSQWG
uniref:Putative secreted protein n=1 Tax=Anopheles darlingi TaxID=43151 RepID=A0A2M4D4K3_ANODA